MNKVKYFLIKISKIMVKLIYKRIGGKKMKKIFIFLAITFLATWTLAFGLMANGGYRNPLTMIILSACMLVPAISVIITTLITKEKFKDVWIKPNFKGNIVDYSYYVNNKLYLKEDKEKYNLFKTIIPSWDNTPRRGNKSTIFYNSSPELYKQWLKDIIIYTKTKKNKIHQPSQQLHNRFYCNKSTNTK